MTPCEFFVGYASSIEPCKRCGRAFRDHYTLRKAVMS